MIEQVLIVPVSDLKQFHDFVDAVHLREILHSDFAEHGIDKATAQKLIARVVQSLKWGCPTLFGENPR